MINVTKSFLPPLNEYVESLKRIWDTHHLTNRGEFALSLENQLEKMFDLKHCLVVANATLGIQLVIKSLNLKGQIITTPFTYIATASSIVWESCTPVFIDIDPISLCIDVTKIRKAINSSTSAILVTHVFGNPCDVDEIEIIGKEFGLYVIYDAAHAFGVNLNGRSIFSYGDVSICSFHATKLFHTGEGGAIFCNSKEIYDKVYDAHNFGHHGYEDFSCLGINGKMSELQAAMGLSILPYLNDIINKRKEIYDYYFEHLANINGIRVVPIRNRADWNYCYLPVVLDREDLLLEIIKGCNNHNIFPRRYFYPSLNTLNFLNPVECQVSEDVAKRIMCLPLHTYMTSLDVDLIANTIKATLNK